MALVITVAVCTWKLAEVGPFLIVTRVKSRLQNDFFETTWRFLIGSDEDDDDAVSMYSPLKSVTDHVSFPSDGHGY